MNETQRKIKEYIKTHESVYIHHNNELCYYVWSVCVECEDFWLDSFKTKKDAINYCQKNKLFMVRIVDDKKE